MMTLAQAHALLPASVLVGEGATTVRRVHSDSRTVQPGDLFVALHGERFDGHDHLAAARAAGAVAGLACHGLQEAGLPGLQVDDTLRALQDLAQAWRHRLHLPVAAVTGSNGKTTTTQMVAAILRAWLGEAALATAGNLNNHIGVPLMLLRLRQDDAQWHRAAVFELGMNHPGEIARLAALTAPTVALVANAQREHQEFMASVQAVAEENGAVIDALGPAGTVVIPADDAFTGLWRQRAGTRRVLDFALDAPAAVTGEAHPDGAGGWSLEIQTPAGAAELTLHVAGRHNARNALAATAVALALGAPLSAVVQGLQAFRPVAGRSAPRTITLDGRRVVLVDDSYNANPDSVAAAIDLLAALPGPHWLLLGDMGEVGTQGPAFHREAGARAHAAGLAHVWCVGVAAADAAAACPGARHFPDVPSLLAALTAGPRPDAGAVLVKGSRFMGMERAVQALTGLAQD
ncbi:MAG: UDP-N-acetylmuramoyl-tripeptide--D-alanyl-D-alanine ligase [Rubrivivax sp.]